MNVTIAEQKYELQEHILAVMKNAIVKIADGKASTCYKHTPFNYIRFVVLIHNCFVVIVTNHSRGYKMICSSLSQ